MNFWILFPNTVPAFPQPEPAFGGSITLVMVPLILFAVRYGAPWGILAGVAFGTLKYFFAEGFAVSWVSIIFDYSVAYGAPCGPFPREGQ